MSEAPDTGLLSRLLARFREAQDRGRLEPLHRARWGRLDEFQGWLSEEGVWELTLGQALELYKASGGRRVREFEQNPIEEIRDSLDFLLYDTIKLEGRFQEFVSEEGAYKLKGAGKEFASYLLCVKDPTLFGVWNPATEKGLAILGLFPKELRRGHTGARYVELLDILWRLRQRCGFPDFCTLDDFLQALARGMIGARED